MKTYGLLLRSEVEYGTEYIEAMLIGREGDRVYPVGITGSLGDYDLPKHLKGLSLDGLTIRGFVSEHSNQFIGYDPEYRGVYAVDLPRARAMARTLDKVTKRRRKDSAYEPGDTLMSLAKTLKLDFAVERIGPPRGSSWSDSDWNWMTVEEGRNRFRAMIEKAREERKAA